MKVQLHTFDCPLSDADFIAGCGCAVIDVDQPSMELIGEVDPPEPTDPERVYLQVASRRRPIRWYDKAEACKAALGLPHWLELPEWPGDAGGPAFVVMQRKKVEHEVCHAGRPAGVRHDYCRHSLKSYYGYVPVQAFARQSDAVRWALTDLELEVA